MAVKNMNYDDDGDDDRRNRTGGNDEILCKMWIDAATTETNFAVNTAVKKYRDSKEQIDYLVTLDSISPDPSRMRTPSDGHFFTPEIGGSAYAGW
jgi:hypothetical protein